MSGITGLFTLIRYPAGHVYIHQFLYVITDSGRNIRLAQHIYGGLYLISVALTSAIYRKAAAPNWLLLLLPLSKRLHSIYGLRLFNDCWAVVSVQASILAYSNGFLEIGTILYACVPPHVTTIQPPRRLTCNIAGPYPSKCRICCIFLVSWWWYARRGACS